MNWLDKTARNAVFKKIKTDNMHTLTELSKKYLPFEEYRKIAPQTVVFVNHQEPPSKGTKAYKNAVKYFKNSLINTKNMVLFPEEESIDSCQAFWDKREADLLAKA